MMSTPCGHLLFIQMEGLSVPVALKLAEFLKGTPDQQDKALALIRGEQTGRGKKTGNGGEDSNDQ